MEVNMILSVKTGAKTELVDITSQVQQVISKAGIGSGICVEFLGLR